MNRFLVIAFLFIVQMGPMAGQTVTYLLDTIYSKGYVTDSFALLHNEQQSWIVDRKGLRAYPSPIEGSIEELGYLLVQIAGKTHLLAENGEPAFTEGIDLIIDDLYTPGYSPTVRFFDSIIAYEANDSVFVDDFRSPGKAYVRTGGIPSPYNNRYLMVTTTDRETFIYSYADRELREIITADDHIRHGANAYLLTAVRYGSWRDTIRVLDLKGNEVFGLQARSEETVNSEDLLIAVTKGKPLAAFYRGNAISLPDEISKIISTIKLEDRPGNVWIVKTKEGTFGLMNDQGQWLHEPHYENIKVTLRRNILLREGEERILLDKNLEVMVRGEYDDILLTYPGLFSVKRGNEWALVDGNNHFVVPFGQDITFDNFFGVREEYGQKLIVGRNKEVTVYYDYEGREIVRWSNHHDSDDTIYWSPARVIPGYSAEMVRQLSPEQVERFNPHNVWVARKPGSSWGKRLVKQDGTPLLPWVSAIKGTVIGNIFLVETRSRKFGLIKVEAP